MNNNKIAIIGGGAWGTALGSNLSNQNKNIILWSRNKKVVESININNLNNLYLPDISLSSNLKSTSSIEELGDYKILIFAVPTQYIRNILMLFKKIITKHTIIINCSKGIERETLYFPSEIFKELVPSSSFAILSGPTFASEVARNLPSAITLACDEKLHHLSIAKELPSESLRLYFSDDIVGVEVGGAIKNIIAIAAGIINGASLGRNAHAALLSRGLAEISRFGSALGAKPQTLMGLSGLGDLTLTSNSNQSRNFSLGNAIGQGISSYDYLLGKKSITEGIYTTEAAVSLAEKMKVDIPIIKAVNYILKGDKTLTETLKEFFSRPLKFEND